MTDPYKTNTFAGSERGDVGGFSANQSKAWYIVTANIPIHIFGQVAYGIWRYYYVIMQMRSGVIQLISKQNITVLQRNQDGVTIWPNFDWKKELIYQTCP